jgi:hypothetical protein
MQALSAKLNGRWMERRTGMGERNSNIAVKSDPTL